MARKTLSHSSVVGAPSKVGIQQKLLPVGGPTCLTASDLAGGEGAESGFMDYGDQEYDDMIEGDEDYGDY